MTKISRRRHTRFLACTVEAVGALTIVLAVGSTRRWESAMLGVGAATPLFQAPSPWPSQALSSAAGDRAGTLDLAPDRQTASPLPEGSSTATSRSRPYRWRNASAAARPTGSGSQ